jgi:nucleotide-binding universal stress UspA family protein
VQRIAAATDFSTRSQRAIRRAGRLAGEFGATLILIHVVDDDQPAEIAALERNEAERYLAEQTSSLAELRDVACRVVVTTGHPAGGILLAAKDERAEVIVVGTHRKQALRDIFVGTTVERIIRTGSLPVLMVNADADQPYRRVLTPIEAAVPSVNAIKTAEALGLADGREVILLHAYVAPGKGKLELAGVRGGQVAAYLAGERRTATNELTAFLQANGIDLQAWKYRFEEGMPFEVISRVAAQTAPDLIVIGTHGRSGLARMLLGSLAEEVLRRMDYDILAVPPSR